MTSRGHGYRRWLIGMADVGAGEVLREGVALALIRYRRWRSALRAGDAFLKRLFLSRALQDLRLDVGALAAD